MSVDFSKLPQEMKFYGGANGKKIAVRTSDGVYMIKFPGDARHNNDMSYTNGCISEHIGSSIFNIIGIKAQETMLGTYTSAGKSKIVVACKDFTYPNYELFDFASVKNSCTSSSSNGFGTELGDVMEAISEQKIINPDDLKEYFWDVFVVDAMLGNWDRHNGNWGFLKERSTNEFVIAPIYDCGSCLYPQADERMMENVLHDSNEMNLRIYERPISALKVNGQKIKYFSYISSLQNSDCNKALMRVLPKINLDAINAFIDSTPFITDLQKNFYKTIIAARKERILDFSLKKYKKSCLITEKVDQGSLQGKFIALYNMEIESGNIPDIAVKKAVKGLILHHNCTNCGDLMKVIDDFAPGSTREGYYALKILQSVKEDPLVQKALNSNEKGIGHMR